MTRGARNRLIATVVALLIPSLLPWAAGASQDAGKNDYVIAVHVHNGVPYLSGGISKAEEATVKKVAESFSLMATFTTTKGQYLEGGLVVITDGAGRQVVESELRGPLFAADLPPGTYTVLASDVEGQPLNQTVEIFAGERRVLHFTWAHHE